MKTTLKNTVLASAALAAMAGLVSPALAADKPAREKCYGVAKAGKNDCATADGKHSCAGSSTKDADGGAWISLPTGICEKLAGGSLKPKSE